VNARETNHRSIPLFHPQLLEYVNILFVFVLYQDEHSLPPISIPILTVSGSAFTTSSTKYHGNSIRLSVQCGPRRCADGGMGGMVAIRKMKYPGTKQNCRKRDGLKELEVAGVSGDALML